MKAKKEKDPQAEAVRFYRCCIIFIVCVCLFWAWEAWVIYQRNPHNKKADDAISRAVYEEMGAKELYYLGKTEYEDGGIRYDYHMEGETAELVPKVADVVNREMEKENTYRRIDINFIHDYDPYEISKAVLSNYRQQDNIFIDYGTLQYLNIDADFDNTYDMYKDIPDIHYLSTRGMAVEELGISQWAERGMGQWKAYWPELETAEILFSWNRGYVNRYEHFLEEGNSLLEEISSAEAQMPAYRKDSQWELAFFRYQGDEAKPLFLVRNYINSSEGEPPEYKGGQYLWIFLIEEDDIENLYFSLEDYKSIPDIRYLRIDEKIQSIADEQGIDWYAYWPELETVEVYVPVQ